MGRVEDDWGDVTSVIRLDDRFSPESRSGLDGFSHVEVVFFFDRVPVDRIETGARHPRGLDALEGTPVLDVKPYMREFEPRGEVRQPDWATELMRAYYQWGCAPPHW